MTRRLLVIGRSGLLARALAERAETAGLSPTFLGRPEIDLENPATVQQQIRILRPDVVLNAAAWTGVDAAEREPARTFAINAAAPGVMARTARESGAAFIHVSTDFVFDGTKGAPYDEDDMPRPLNVYGRSKREGEERVLAACPEALVVRTAWLLGPFGTNFVRFVLDAAKSGRHLRIVADRFGSPTSVLDFADGLLRATAMPDSRGGGILHLAGTGDASWHDVAARALATSGALGGPLTPLEAISAAEWPYCAPRPVDTRLDSRRFAARFGHVMPDWRIAVDGIVRRILAGAPER